MKRIFRIEPHGFGTNTFYDIQQIDCLIKVLLKGLEGYDYINQEINDDNMPKEYLELFQTFTVQIVTFMSIV